MTNAELIAEASRQTTLAEYRTMGTVTAQALQDKSLTLTATEIVAQSIFVPNFENAIANKNMSEREIGFICQTTDGNVWKLRQSYDSTIYMEQPSYYPALWLLVITSNPADAKPFVQSSEILYMIGNCCTWEENTYRSLADNNVYSPTDAPQNWELVEE